VFGVLLAATGYLLLIPASRSGLVLLIVMAASGIALMALTMTNECVATPPIDRCCRA
jgi:DHA2 family methylenomycin A resistance protein-like MFS transporter